MQRKHKLKEIPCSSLDGGERIPLSIRFSSIVLRFSPKQTIYQLIISSERSHIKLLSIIMSVEAVAAAAPAAPSVATPKSKKVAAKKTSVKKVIATHPTFASMIATAVTALKERNGSSRQAILKYILANFKVGDADKAQGHVRIALRKMIAAKKIVAGGAAGKKGSGCFKLPAPVKAEKPAKKTVKKPVAKKAAKKPAVKKVAAKPAAKKAVNKPAAKKPAAKKPAAKKPAAKKPAAKKVAAKK